MKYIILIITLCLSTILFANPKINPVANNNNYLFVQLETLPIIDINITFNNGSFNDGDLKGLTNLMLNTYMSSNIDNKKIISYFENVGAKLSYTVGKESLSITIRTLNDIDQALVLTNIINKALRMDKLDSNILKLEKDKILRNIEDSKKRPATLLSSSISAKLFLNSGLAHQVIGDKSSVNKITDIQIINHGKKVFNLEDIEINIVGDITESNSKRLISSITNKLTTNRTLVVDSYKMQSSDHHTEFDSTQSHLAVIIPAIKREDPDYHNILVANYIFGGSGFGSWLMEEIRQKRGLSYSVYSYLASTRNEGYLKISLQTKNENLSQAKEIITTQINRLMKFDVSEEEVETVKKSILRSFEMKTDTNKKILNLVSAINNLNLELNYFENYKNKLDKVSKSTIQNALINSIDFNNISTLSVGKTIE
jgi:zinc protease